MTLNPEDMPHSSSPLWLPFRRPSPTRSTVVDPVAQDLYRLARTAADHVHHPLDGLRLDLAVQLREVAEAGGGVVACHQDLVGARLAAGQCRTRHQDGLGGLRGEDAA